jgi:stage IV sporulation protein FB
MENLNPIFSAEIPADLPKPVLEEKKNKTNIWLKSIASLVLYLAIGYFFFSHRWMFLLIITAIFVFHELGHFTAMKIFRYNDLGIFFIPLLGAYVSGTKQEVSQKQSAIILLAGPVPGILLGIGLIVLADNYSLDFFGGISPYAIANALIFLNLLNLLPVYPLDGGQLLHRLFLDDNKIIGKIFVIISATALVWFALFGLERPFYPLLLIPFFMISRMIGDIQHDRITAKIEAEGVDLNKTYEELSAEEYWKIRNLVIRYYPSLSDIRPSPPYEISPKEDQVITTIQSLLQRSLIQDLSIAGKFLILVIWIGSFLVPIFLNLPLRFF